MKAFEKEVRHFLKSLAVFGSLGALAQDLRPVMEKGASGVSVCLEDMTIALPEGYAPVARDKNWHVAAAQVLDLISDQLRKRDPAGCSVDKAEDLLFRSKLKMLGIC